MAQLIRGLDARRVADNLARVREEIGDEIQVLAAVKYVAVEEMGVLAEAGVTVVGENRAQELAVKAQAHPDLTWDFIGHLQSRKVKQVLPHVRWIHSVASESALDQLGKHGDAATEVLVEVNVARDEGKSGVLPEALDGFLERAGRVGRVHVVGLMTMPPFTERAEDSRRWFAALAALAGERGLRELSMGTSQDYAVAAQEGATIVRLGTSLYT
jgi:pyridoxal phosphate enzyme (YggS family)